MSAQKKKKKTVWTKKHSGHSVKVENGSVFLDKEWTPTHVVMHIAVAGVCIFVASYTSRPQALRHAKRLRAALKLEAE